MVVESLLNPEKGIRHGLSLAGVGFIYALLAGIVAYVMFKEYASVAMVFLTIIAAIPFMYMLITHEARREVSLIAQSSLFKEYGHITKGLLALFQGITCGYLALYLFVPTAWRTSLFLSQQDTIVGITGQLIGGETVMSILLNNVQVLGVSLLLAFLYGFGALTIIVWNASVVAVAIGDLFGSLSNNVGMAVFFAFSKYMLHGIPEIAAYVLAGLAGGIISVAMVNNAFGTHRWRRVLTDASKLVVFSVLILVFAAVVEVYVSANLV